MSSVEKTDHTLIMDNVDTTRLVVHKSKLLVVSGPLQGKEFIVGKEVFSIGSGPNSDLVLKDSTVSRQHCEIQSVAGGSIIRDLGSTNGTFLQGVRVAEAYLGQGTEIQTGKTKMIFCPLQETTVFPLSPDHNFGNMVGKSVPMRRVFHQAGKYAATDATVLLEGETGTGKDILAEELHKHSKRKNKPFIVIDCAALSKELIGSELFGHKKGAFTGAQTDRVGAFEQADGGTVFLDEISVLSPELQPQLLRVLEKREIRRLGSNDIRKINVRIISATNQKLESEINEGRFREDLYYRLSVVHIEIPPLRKRKQDIPLMIEKFVRDLHGEAALERIVDYDKTMDAFRTHEWPGNVRELRNVVEIALYEGDDDVDLGAFLYLGRMKSQNDNRQAFTADRPFKEAKQELIRTFEREYLRDLLDRNDGNISKAAREAGIERAYLQRLIRKSGDQPS